ncbi:sulfotransferase [Halomonas sp. KAO]|uniref:sulfotransferase n=1 Tax=Halomonas sp. KAO TaxID=2783858 RepID=UPI0018A06381|nr:sulfotransferase [Halomonas sp. KAO]MBF7051767.1 sulfotransferase [Halomonas sp. KAO]
MLNTPPVIIFGNPRSGTRMCANVLDLHPEICITDEFQNVGMLNNLANQQISSFMKKRVDPDSIPLRKEFLVKNYWLMRSSLKQIDKSQSSRVVGNKTPRAEHHYELYEEIFSVNKPIYVYCARNAHDVLRSIKNLKNIQWSQLPFDELFENYKNSYRALAIIQEKSPERVFVVNVDHYESSELFSFYKNIFNSLEVGCDKALIEKINALGPQNTMQKVRSMTKDDSPIAELSDEELAMIDGCPEYKKIKSDMLF